MTPSRRLLSFVLIATWAASAGAQAPALAPTPAPGRLLIANPGLDDPNFSQTVLLILIHRENDGSAAVFLNRPTWVDPAEAFPEVEGLERYQDALYLGGPVGVAELLTIFESDGPAPDGALPLSNGVFFSPNPAVLNQIDFAAADHPRARVYAGYAEWGAGQLAQEIAAGRWRVLRAESADVFDEEPAGLWQHLMLAIGGVRASNIN
jgi:putative transcriptional regulator